MAAIRNYIASFNSGELSPRMLSRPDVSQYHSGCRVLENFLVTAYGSIERRPGTVSIGAFNEVIPEDTPQDRMEEAKEAYRGNIRLVKFIFNRNNSYLLMLKSDCVDIYNANTLELATTISGDDYPYKDVDLYTLSFAQSGDIVFIVCPTIAPQQLKRTAASSFVFEEMAFEYPPMLDENTEPEHTLWNTHYKKGDVTDIYSWMEEFSPASVGRHIQIRQSKSGNRMQWTLKSNNNTVDDNGNFTSYSLEIFGSWTLTSHGTWTGELELQRSFDGGNTWETYANISSAKDNNASISGDETTEDALYRIQMTGYVQSGSGTIRACKVTLDNSQYSRTGIVKITEHIDARHVKGVIVKKLAKAMPPTLKDGAPSKRVTGNTYWSWGAFHDDCQPTAIAFYESRLYMGGTADHPDRLWGSRVNDYANFLVKGEEDDAGLDFTLASQNVSTIRWMIGKGALIIGTTDSEWTIGSQSSARGALTAGDLKCTRQSAYGSSHACSALLAEDSVIFLQRGSRKLRVFRYSWEQDNYIAEDLTIFAEHILNAKVKSIALQTNPDTIIWVLLQDGTICALTYDSAQKVVGWTRITRVGFCRALEVVPSQEEDRVFMVTDFSACQHDDYRVMSLDVMMPRKVDPEKRIYMPFLDSATIYDATLGYDNLGYTGPEHYKAVVDGSQPKPENFDTGIRRILGLPSSSIQFLTVSDYDDEHSLKTCGCHVLSWDGMQVKADGGRLQPICDQFGEVMPPKEGWDKYSEEGNPWPHQDYKTALPRSFAWFGYKYESVASPMPPQLQLAEGFSCLRLKTVAHVRISAYDSVGGMIKVDDGQWQQIPAFDKQRDAMDSPVQCADRHFTGAGFGGYHYDNHIVIKQDKPFPFNLSAISVALTVTE